MRPSHYIIAGAICIVPAVSAYSAGGDPEAGRRKTVTCNGCHAQASMQSVPSLGGQSVAYFLSAMRAYQDGKRSHATMRDVAKAYSDKELKNFAAYYAQLGATGDGEVAADGKPAVTASCEACHGENGRKPTNPESAVLAGQKASYLKAVVREYRDGTRKHEIMQGATAGLADEDIDALAEYYAKLPGLVVK